MTDTSTAQTAHRSWVALGQCTGRDDLSFAGLGREVALEAHLYDVLAGTDREEYLGGGRQE